MNNDNFLHNRDVKASDVVCSHIYKIHGEDALKFIDPELIKVINFLSHTVFPMQYILINNYKGSESDIQSAYDEVFYEERGLRCNLCKSSLDRTRSSECLVEPHILGKAIDFNVYDSPDDFKTKEPWGGADVLAMIDAFAASLPVNVRIDWKEYNWCHIDVLGMLESDVSLRRLNIDVDSEVRKSSELFGGFLADVTFSPDCVNMLSSTIEGIPGTPSGSAPSTVRVKKSKKEFTRLIYKAIERYSRPKGLHPVLVVTQAAIESGWGSHAIANYNLWGIKGNASNGVLYRTTEYLSTSKVRLKKGENVISITKSSNGKYKIIANLYFRHFRSMDEAANYYVNKLVMRPRYKPARDVVANCALNSKYFYALGPCGYYNANPAQYEKTCRSIMNDIYSAAKELGFNP